MLGKLYGRIKHTCAIRFLLHFVRQQAVRHATYAFFDVLAANGSKLRNLQKQIIKSFSAA